MELTRTKFPASEIDWADDSGIIAFKEYQKKQQTSTHIKDELVNVISLSPKEWALIFLHANGGNVLKIPLFKEMFIFSQRTGLGEPVFEWYPYDYGPYCIDIEYSLEKLEEEEVILKEIGKTGSGRIFKKYSIVDPKKGEELWNLLPEKFKSVISELITEFNDLDISELLDYIYSAYPEYAIKSKFMK